jgi:hypothetical protein
MLINNFALSQNSFPEIAGSVLHICHTDRMLGFHHALSQSHEEMPAVQSLHTYVQIRFIPVISAGYRTIE